MVKVFGPMMSHYASGTLTGPAICSSSLRNRRAREATPEPPLPTPDYIVAGTVNPDCTGEYFYAGQYAGYPYYERGDHAYFLWAEPLPPPRYIGRQISTNLGGGTDPNWYNLAHPLITGEYYPAQGATGTAIVSTPP